MDKGPPIEPSAHAAASGQQEVTPPPMAATDAVSRVDSTPPPVLGLEGLRAQLREISAIYAQELPTRMQVLEATFAEAHRQNFSPESLDSLSRQVHKMSGSAATFGFPALTDAARQLEVLLRAILRGEVPDPLMVVAELQRALQALQVAAQKPQV